METSIIEGTNTIVYKTQKDENLHGLLNGMKIFAVNHLKERIVFLENDLKQKDTVINFFTK